MEQETRLIEYDGVVVPESALVCVERRNPYGSVPGLDDEELADPDELERQVMLEEWRPVLTLPVRGKRNLIQPVIDENGGIEWGAFGTVDFERTMSAFDRALYKADRLREQLRDILILLGIVQGRLPKAKYLVLKYVRMGVIELEHIVNEDMQAAANLFLRARRLQTEIAELKEVSRGRTRRECAWLMT